MTENASGYLPPGWPDGVHPPGSERFEQTAVGWLLDVVPPDYRMHGVLRRHPVALAALARHHLAACVTGARDGYRVARAELGRELPPASLDAVLAAYRSEGQRLVATAEAVALVEQALRGGTFTPRMDGRPDRPRDAAAASRSGRSGPNSSPGRSPATQAPSAAERSAARSLDRFPPNSRSPHDRHSPGRQPLIARRPGPPADQQVPAHTGAAALAAPAAHGAGPAPRDQPEPDRRPQLSAPPAHVPAEAGPAAQPDSAALPAATVSQAQEPESAPVQSAPAFADDQGKRVITVEQRGTQKRADTAKPVTRSPKKASTAKKSPAASKSGPSRSSTRKPSTAKRTRATDGSPSSGQTGPSASGSDQLAS